MSFFANKNKGNNSDGGSTVPLDSLLAKITQVENGLNDLASNPPDLTDNETIVELSNQVGSILDGIDSKASFNDLEALKTEIENNVPSLDHQHAITDIQNLQVKLDEINSIASNHNHEIADIGNLQSKLDEINELLNSHVHDIDMSDVNGLTAKITEIEGLIINLSNQTPDTPNTSNNEALLELSGKVDSILLELKELDNKVSFDDLEAVKTEIANNTPSIDHKHEIGDIQNLQSKLDEISTLLNSHTHEINVSDVNGLTAKITELENLITTLSNQAPETPDISNSEELIELSNRVDAIVLELENLDTISSTELETIKAEIKSTTASLVHKHEISDVNELQTQLDEKALKTDLRTLKTNFENHVHEISQVNGLQQALDGKSPTVHNHAWNDITGRPQSSTGEIDNSVTLAHEHSNISVLSGLEDGGGVLLYNGSPLGEASFLAVQNIEERDNLPLDIRKEGLTVLTTEDNSIYYLKGGIDNAFWSIFSVGAGGATTASTLPATPSGTLVGLNVQSILDELEVKKANQSDVYTKAETENFIKGYPVDYFTLENLPDISSLHGHDNKTTLDLFGQYQGSLTWNGKTLGDLVTEIYDADKDGIIDVSATLYGLVATINELNYLTGATGNLQAQINAISSGVTFKGEFATYDEMVIDIPSPNKGDLVYIKTDENKNGAIDTQYCFDGTDWIYGGGTTKTPDATLTTKGVMQLGGDLAHPSSTASSPKLTPTGVTAGLYKSANVTIGEDGRITHAEEGSVVFLNDTIVSESEGWSSQKVNSELEKLSPKNHTHAQLHDAKMLGSVELSEDVKPINNTVPTYDAVTGKAIWKEQQGGKVFVGSKFIQGDYTLKAGSYITLLVDDVTKEITISSTYRENGGNIIPTGVEVVHSVEVPASSKVRFSVESGYNKVMLHTIQMQNNKDVTGEIRVYNQGQDGFIEYNSNPEIMISDIVNIPIFDSDNSKMLHFEIENLGIEDSTFTLRAKITNLL